jgi:hypothetical protein
MKIIIPVSQRDLKLAESLSELLLEQGGLGAHHGVLLTAPNCTALDGTIASNLQKAFGTFTRLALEGGITEVGAPANPFQPYVYAANQMFQTAVRWLASTNNQDEFYWFEADNVPLRKGWADEFSKDYMMSVAMKRPFLGKVLPLAIFNNNNGEITIKDDPEQPYMMGSGIYPARVDQFSQLWKLAKSLPWDTTMQWEVVPRCTPTDKIIHNHSTKDYKVADGQLTCSFATEPSRSTKTPIIPKEALVFHGCKDDSLIKIISSGALDKKAKVGEGDKTKK